MPTEMLLVNAVSEKGELGTASKIGQKSGEWSTNGIAARSEPNGEITVNNVTIANYAFQYRPITKVNLRNLTGTGNRCFDSCTNLEEVSLHSWYFTCGQYMFADCTAMTKATFAFGNSSSGELKSGTFSGCTHLEAADLGPNIRNMNEKAFQNCDALQTLILRRSSSIVSLANSNIFSGTPLASGGTGCTIYIPKALYDHLGDGTSLDYKAATIWSTYDGYGTITWAKLEGSAYETKYLDGMSI